MTTVGAIHESPDQTGAMTTERAIRESPLHPPYMKLALKIDVDTFRGTREGVPRLIDLLQKHNAGATFLFSLGPDHTGRAITRAFRPGFMTKV